MPVPYDFRYIERQCKHCRERGREFCIGVKDNTPHCIYSEHRERYLKERDNIYYIQDTRQFVGNSMSWWRQNGSGYTCDLREAGIFLKEEAEKICRNRDTDKMWEKSYIDLRVQHHVDMQDV